MSKKLRERRLEEAQRQQTRQRILLIAGVIGAVVLIGTIVYLQWPDAIHDLREFSGLSRGHAVEVDLDTIGRPPVGGTHNPAWMNCGVYREPLEAAMAVHSLEHGAVWLTYHPDLPAEEIAQLESYAEGDSWVLVSPYPGQESNIIASAWGAQVDIEEATDERVVQFLDRYKGQGPERGASCTGGVGTPVS